MRVTRVIARAASLLLLCGVPAVAQRSSGDPGRAADDFLDQCRNREGRNRDNDDRVRVCDVREKRISAPRQLDVDGQQNGSVSVHGWNRSEVLVLAKAQAEEESDARDIASGISVDVSGGRVRADGPSMRRGQNWSVSYEIWAPRQTDLHVSTQNGGVSVDDMDARLELGAVNGGISLHGVSGDVRGETTNGSVTVELDGDQWRGPGLDLRTTNGPVTVDIPEGYSARLETGTVNGPMVIDFPVTLQGTIGRRISTQLGRGGATIRAVTTNGPVAIHRR